MYVGWSSEGFRPSYNEPPFQHGPSYPGLPADSRWVPPTPHLFIHATTMKTEVVFLLHGTAIASASTLAPSDIEVLIPKESPAGKSDHRECATHDYEVLVEPPKPTGSLRNALESYNEEAFRETCTATGIEKLDCPPVGYPELCGFATAAPDSLLPAYTSHGSSASSWWAAHSSSALSVASECPHYWYEAMSGTFLAASWLNQTIAHAQCYEAGITGAEPAETGPTATSDRGLADDAPEETGDPDSGVMRAGAASMLVVAASVLAAATVNAL